LDPIRRHNVHVAGRGATPLLFAHGFGCDQTMWRFLTPHFEADFRTVLFDHVGAGGADPAAYSTTKHSSLRGYAEDVIALADALQLAKPVFVGHSVSAMIGALAAIRRPDLFGALVMVGPSPCYLNDGDYRGGFGREDIEGLLDLLDENPLGWASAMAPTIMGNPDRPELAEELRESFCRTDPAIAHAFARVTFLADNRADLPGVEVRTLVLQCSDDAIAPDAVGEYVARRLPDATFRKLQATGHCPHLSAPGETAAAIRDFLSRSG
jgi:sigma-B regulation protein RsbQ